MDIEKLRYPIGKYNPGEIKDEMITPWIEALKTFPDRLIAEIKDIDSESLKYTYRPESWTVRHLVHHLADSHMNSIIRFKWTLTEDNPTIKPYLENEWSKLPDVQEVPIEASINILRGVHARLSTLLSHLDKEEFSKTFVHPEHGKTMNLAYLAGMYVWHGNHHLEHIKAALKMKKVGWN